MISFTYPSRFTFITLRAHASGSFHAYFSLDDFAPYGGLVREGAGATPQAATDDAIAKLLAAEPAYREACAARAAAPAPRETSVDLSTISITLNL